MRYLYSNEIITRDVLCCAVLRCDAVSAADFVSRAQHGHHHGTVRELSRVVDEGDR